MFNRESKSYLAYNDYRVTRSGYTIFVLQNIGVVSTSLHRYLKGLLDRSLLATPPIVSPPYRGGGV
jgi:hypothetical protein